ncbi:MAG: hypothetical protein IJ411_02055 [Oscillospiraceae bacterium]|nr:hypothetical protein [Oscillospiraceae bacterium]
MANNLNYRLIFGRFVLYFMKKIYEAPLAGAKAERWSNQRLLFHLVLFRKDEAEFCWRKTRTRCGFYNFIRQFETILSLNKTTG